MARLGGQFVAFGLLLGLVLGLPRAVTGAPAAVPARASKWEVSLAPAGEPGVPFEVMGTLLALPDSLPVRDATVYAYHADASGKYGGAGENHPHLSGTLRTDVLGRFRIRTVLPGTAEGIPHVHFVLRVTGIREQMRTVTLCRHVGAGSDTAYAKLPWMVKLPTEWGYAEPAADGGYLTKITLYLDRRRP